MRKMFCAMVNQYLPEHSKFDLNNEEMFNNSLLKIFEERIISFFQFYKFKPESSQKIVKIYTYDSLLLNQYFKQSKNFKMQYLSKSIKFNPKFKMLFGYSHPSVDLIQLIFNGKELEIMLDLNKIFTQTLYTCITKEISNNISIENPYLHVRHTSLNNISHMTTSKHRKTNPYLYAKGEEKCLHTL